MSTPGAREGRQGTIEAGGLADLRMSVWGVVRWLRQSQSEGE